MNRRTWLFILGCLLLLPNAAGAAFVPTFGTTWDAPATSLQNIVDAAYGPGLIDVATDYIGHDAGDPDPWFWQDANLGALIVREIAGNADNNLIGWYQETALPPVIDGVDDGVVFSGPMGAGASVLIPLGPNAISFGFYMNPNGTGGAINAPEPERFYTNRLWNDFGPGGGGSAHSPTDGDVQALVYDISNVVNRPNTWLVAWEDLDSGADPSPCCTPTDNDYNDFVMEVTAIGATPAQAMTIGQLKARFAR